ncbi:MAG: prepilin-type N-terminal cleavage/methylation domain-containing protein [Alphaproteobacteria bacterium]|nr:prepilin-type N-terminal cleavage/methylation domain-containing protein [Alphaproteobacteria bacterium]
MGTKTNQSGRSMIEMLGVLAIIGVLSVGGIAGYSKAKASFLNSDKFISSF